MICVTALISANTSTNKPLSLTTSGSISNEQSDEHKMIYGVFTARLPKLGLRSIVYRRIKHFNGKAFKQDLEAVPYQRCEIFDDPEHSYWALDYLHSKVLDKHAPINEKTLRPKGLTYINKE